MYLIKRFYTATLFSQAIIRIDMTLDYLEQVSERKEIEERVQKDIHLLSKWVYRSAYRKEMFLERETRWKQLLKKRKTSI